MQLVHRVGGYVTEERGLVPMKGKGEVLTYWLKGATDNIPISRVANIQPLKPLFR